MDHKDNCDGCSVDAAGYPLCRSVYEIEAFVAQRRKDADARLGGPLTWVRFQAGDADPGDVEVSDRHFLRWQGRKGIWMPKTGIQGALTWKELLASEYAPITAYIRVPEEEQA